MNLKELIIFGIENSSEPVIKNPILREALEVGTPTKEVTQYGRRIYETPEGDVSEKSTTFFFNGKWLNVPSIHGGRAFTDDQLRGMIKRDEIEPTSEHGSRIEAEEAAGQRSNMMKSHTRGFDDGGRIGYDDGQLVQNTVDGSRPGYSGLDDFIIKKRKEAKKKGLVYDLKTKSFRKREKRSDFFKWLKKGISIEDLDKRIVELGKTGEHKKIEIYQILKDEGYLKPLSKGKKFWGEAIEARLTEVLTTEKIKLPTITEIQSDAFMKLVKKHPKVDTIGGIADLAQKELNLEFPPYQLIKKWAKENKIKLLTRDEKIFPEIKALDKLVKKKQSLFENIQRGVRGIENNPHALSKALLSEMKKLGFNLTPAVLQNRLVKLDALYSGRLEPGTKYATDIYKKIKPIKNYTNSKLKKGLFATAKRSGKTSVIQEAQMLGLPDKDIALLEDVFAGSRKLSNVKIAGDHTDSNALMRAVLSEKNWKQYKKDFMRINVISNTLNKAKMPFDQKIQKAHRDWNNKLISGQEFNKIVAETKADLLKKTKIPIGNPKVVNDTFQFNFLTERMGDLKNPRNKAVLSAMNNLVKQSGVKFKGIDQELMFANTAKEKFNVLRNAGIDQLKQSKYIKAFSKMGGKVGKAAKLIIAGGAGATAVATVANASETGVIDTAKSLPVEHPWLTGGAATAASKFTKADPLKLLRKLPRKILSSLGTPTGALAAWPLSAMGMKKAGWMEKDVPAFDIKSTGDRIGAEAELALAPTLVKWTDKLTKPIKNKAVRSAATQLLNLGMKPAMAMRVARIASPLGLLSLGGEGLYHMYKKGHFDKERMMPSLMDKEAYKEAQQEQFDKDQPMFAGGGIANLKIKW